MDKHFNHLVPLLLFTGLATIAAGLMVGSAAMMLNFHAVSAVSPLILSAFISISIGTLISLFHLGRKERFMRAILGIQHSWLSREVVMASMLAVSAGGAYGLLVLDMMRELFIYAVAIGAVAGLMLAATIGMVYNLMGRTTWNGIINRWAPVISALLLGTGSIYIFSWQPRFKEVFLILWAADLLFAVGRAVIFFKGKRGETLFVFPQLLNLTGYAHGIRLVFSLIMLVASLTQYYPAITGMVVGTILLDRYALYTGTVEVSPRSEIAAEKAIRMHRALSGESD